MILISVAGLESGDFLDPWGHVAAADAPAPHARAGPPAREGTVGVQLLPPSPGASYTAHATLVTGRRSAGHGVTADEALDAEGQRALPFWDNRLMRGTALWDAAIGRGALALGWPTTVGARIELVVPDALPEDPTLGWLATAKRLSTPLLARELEAIAEADLAEDRDRDPRSWPSASEKDAAFVEVACRIAASDRDPALWLIRLDQTAGLAARSGWGSVEQAEGLRRIDAGLGRLLACLEEQGRLADTALFVVGDVAWRPVHTVVEPNVALVRRGLIGRDPRSSTGVRSWLALARSHGRSAYVYARDAASALGARELLEAEGRRTGAFEVVPAAELAESGADPQAWFGLLARPGFAIGNRLVGDLLVPAERRAEPGGLHSRDPGAIAVGLVAWGRGVRAQVRIPVLEGVDVAPTVASLLGLRLDDDVEGQPLIGMLRAAVPPPPPGPKRLGADSGDDVQRTLRELGGGRDLGGDR
ncbi:MAG: alkaline phosphatase family protein [Myxococcota bacterium]